MEIKDDDKDKVQAALDMLSEHFDSVQIFTTRHEAGELNGTVNVKMGVGNWFSRYGVVKEWLIIEESYMSQCYKPKEEE